MFEIWWYIAQKNVSTEESCHWNKLEGTKNSETGSLK